MIKYLTIIDCSDGITYIYPYPENVDIEDFIVNQTDHRLDEISWGASKELKINI